MAMLVRCPACGASCSITENASRPVPCPQCGKSFVAKPTFDGQKTDTKKSNPSANGNPFPTLPAEFGRYRVLELLGRGGMGAVYLAEDSQLGRRVALKIPFFDAKSPQRVERFAREARSAAMLSHPNICTVFDSGEIDGKPFITMTYIAGTPLEKQIDPDEPMPQRRAVEIVRKIALALEYAHKNGTVHRDLKPANVMMTAEGEPVVMDFGLAKRVGDADPNEAKLTRSGAIVGTPSYMSPEQVKGDIAAIGPATDIYSLGVILFELLTGRTPYVGSMGMVLGQILAAPVPPLKEFRPDVDSRLDAICSMAMAKAPADRYASVTEFAKALAQFLGNLAAPNPPESIAASRPVNESLPATQDHLFHADASPFEISVDAQGSSRAPRKSKSRQAAGIAIALAIIGVGIWFSATLLRVEKPNGSECESAVPPIMMPLPPGVTPGEPKPGEERSFEIADGVKMVFCWIPPGNAKLGLPPASKRRHANELERDYAQPNGFWMGKYETTQQEWMALMKTSPFYFHKDGLGKDKVIGLDTSRFPVEQVNWYDAQKFLDELNKRSGARQVLGKEGKFRLPTGDEWEYAYRGGLGNGQRFYWGDAISPKEANCERGLSRSTEVGSYEKVVPHPWGLCDMSGNVWEWCDDWFDENRETKKRHSGAWRWGDLCDAAYVRAGKPDETYDDIGFRVCFIPSETDSGFVPLFNGKDLTGWNVEPNDKIESWAVENGEIVLRASTTSTNRTFLQTNKDYADFILRFDVQFEEGSMTGITLRSIAGETFPVSGNDIWKDHPHVLLRDKPGTSYFTGTTNWVTETNANPPSHPAELNPTGSWNRVEIEMINSAFKLIINDRLVVETSINKDARLSDGTLPGLNRAKGSIGLIKYQGTCRYRNIRIKERSQATPENGFVPLFNGKDLTGWEHHPEYPGQWTVVDGVLQGRATAAPPERHHQSYLRTIRKDYSDFQLHTEARINRGGGGGIFFRVSKEGEIYPSLKDDRWITGYKVDIEAKKDFPTWTGGLMCGGYILANPTYSPVKPGEWFAMDIIVSGFDITIKINDRIVNQYNRPDFAHRSAKGFISLEAYNATSLIEFRKIEIRELQANNATAPVKQTPISIDPKLRQSVRNRTGKWLIEGNELVQDQMQTNCCIAFGDYNWTDYDFSAEIKSTYQNNQIGLLYHISGDNIGQFGQGNLNTQRHLWTLEGGWRNRELAVRDGVIESERWYKWRVQARGKHCKCFIDDQLVCESNDTMTTAGAVGFRCEYTSARFRNCRVTDPSGKVLFEGLPNIPEPPGQWPPSTQPASPAELRVLNGHGAGISDAVFTSEGNNVLSTCNGSTNIIAKDGKSYEIYSPESTAILWQLNTGNKRISKTIRPNYENRPLRNPAVLRDGSSFLLSRFLYGHTTMLVQIWSVENDALVPRDTIGEFPGVGGLAFSKDNQNAIIINKTGSLWEWNIAQKKIVRTFENNLARVVCIAMAPGGKAALFARLDQPLTELDLLTGKETNRWTENAGKVRSIAISADESRVLTGYPDGTARLWDARRVSASKTAWYCAFVLIV